MSTLNLYATIDGVHHITVPTLVSICRAACWQTCWYTSLQGFGPFGQEFQGFAQVLDFLHFKISDRYFRHCIILPLLYLGFTILGGYDSNVWFRILYVFWRISHVVVGVCVCVFLMANTLARICTLYLGFTMCSWELALFYLGYHTFYLGLDCFPDDVANVMYDFARLI